MNHPVISHVNTQACHLLRNRKYEYYTGTFLEPYLEVAPLPGGEVFDIEIGETERRSRVNHLIHQLKIVKCRYFGNEQVVVSYRLPETRAEGTSPWMSITSDEGGHLSCFHLIEFAIAFAMHAQTTKRETRQDQLGRPDFRAALERG